MSQAFDGIVHPITAPTLIRDSDNDQYLKGQPHLAEKALTSASTTRGAAAGVGDVGVAVQAMAAGSCRRFSTTLVTLTEKRGRRGAHPRGWPGADPPGDVRRARHHADRLWPTSDSGAVHFQVSGGDRWQCALPLSTFVVVRTIAGTG
jgi:hypothetical protein